MKRLPLLTVPLPTPEEMRRWDETAHRQFGIPPLLLMENAAQAALNELRRHISLTPDTRILIFMGRGNNGGDGAALARLVQDEGCTVLVYSLAPLHDMQGAAGRHVAMARALGINVLDGSSFNEPVLPLEWRTPHVIVDAIAGTGLRGTLRPNVQTLISFINRSRDASFVFSLDIPSGLCGLAGRPMPDAVRAHATVCFEAGKPGLFFPEAGEYTGFLAVRRVGIPIAVRGTVPPSWELLAPEHGTWPPPSPFRHKGDGGKVLIVGGSASMAGAPMLAALGSLRAGAGLVHAACPGGIAAYDFPEVQAHRIGKDSVWQERDARALLELIEALTPDALVIGPGLGRTLAACEIVKAVLEKKRRPPAIVDADALYCFRREKGGPVADSGAPSALPLGLLHKNDIITPHPGEMARLLPPEACGSNTDTRARTAWVQANRPEALQALTAQCNAIVVLKGAGTLIGRKGMATVLCPTAVSSLAVGGSGDVLSGICGALVAAGLASTDAAKLGVYLHARAGELLMRVSPLGHTAGEIAHAVPAVWKELCKA